MTAVAQVTITMSWVDADGNSCRPASTIVACPYSVVDTGSITVPPNTPANTEFDIPCNGIPGDATLVFLENETDAEFTTAWSSNWTPNLPSGGTVLLANPAVRAANCVNPSGLIRLISRGVVVHGGSLVYRVFGT